MFANYRNDIVLPEFGNHKAKINPEVFSGPQKGRNTVSCRDYPEFFHFGADWQTTQVFKKSSEVQFQDFTSFEIDDFKKKLNMAPTITQPPIPAVGISSFFSTI